MRGLDWIARLFRQRQAAPEGPPPLPSRKGERKPVPHGPTKAPFSRAHRRERNLAASHSRARNRT